MVDHKIEAYTLINHERITPSIFGIFLHNTLYFIHGKIRGLSPSGILSKQSNINSNAHVTSFWKQNYVFDRYPFFVIIIWAHRDRPNTVYSLKLRIGFNACNISFEPLISLVAHIHVSRLSANSDSCSKPDSYVSNFSGDEYGVSWNGMLLPASQEALWHVHYWCCK